MAAHTPSRPELRRFGLVLTALLALVAVVPLLRGGEVRVWAAAPALAVFVPALLLPTWLWPVHWLFLRIGMALGWINTRILLGIMFYGVFTPIGVARRLMARRARQAPGWARREPVDTVKQMEHLF